MPDKPPRCCSMAGAIRTRTRRSTASAGGRTAGSTATRASSTQSLIGKPGTPDDERVALHSGVWRYHPVRARVRDLRARREQSVGPRFQRSRPSVHDPLPQLLRRRRHHLRHPQRPLLEPGQRQLRAASSPTPAPDFAPDLKNFLPASARYDSGEGGAGKPGTTAIYGGHSHVGTMIYLGDNWPEIYRDHLFTQQPLRPRR